MEISAKDLVIKKTTVVAFRLHEQIKAALVDAATAQNMTTAEFCERLVMRELKRQGLEITATVNLI